MFVVLVISKTLPSSRVLNNSSISINAENPTHYGPTSPVDGQCKADEKELILETPIGCGTDDIKIACLQCSKPCKTVSDCPMDLPPSTSATPSCWGSPLSCVLKCSSDDDCPLGAKCVEYQGYKNDKHCAFQQASDCYWIGNIDGSWVSISSSSGQQTVRYEEGVTHVHSIRDSSSWGTTVTASTKAGFSAFGSYGSVSVTGTVSANVSHSYSDTFTMSEKKTYTYNFGPGVVWQWKFNVHNGCGKAVASGHDLALTPNALAPPCCLPGMFLDIRNPVGGCLASTPRICSTALVEVHATAGDSD